MRVKPLFLQIIGTMRLNESQWQPVEVEIGFTIYQSPTVIGSQRLSEASVVLPYAGVSRRQASVFWEGGAWFIKDMGSDNGTWLIQNDQKVWLDKPLRIEAGADFLLGSVVVHLVTENETLQRLPELSLGALT